MKIIKPVILCEKLIFNLRLIYCGRHRRDLAAKRTNDIGSEFLTCFNIEHASLEILIGFILKNLVGIEESHDFSLDYGTKCFSILYLMMIFGGHG